MNVGAEKNKVTVFKMTVQIFQMCRQIRFCRLTIGNAHVNEKFHFNLPNLVFCAGVNFIEKPRGMFFGLLEDSFAVSLSVNAGNKYHAV